ncbi:MAG TPA: hypothetical protein VMH85_01675 [Terriglobales bacterium]|nr:hypothetical protein [Terriglobales bacterium]
MRATPFRPIRPFALKVAAAAGLAVLTSVVAVPVLAQPACEAVFAAADKLNTVPNHIYETTVAAYTNGKPQSSEVVAVGGALYVFTHGKWMKVPMSVDDRRKQEIENRKNAKNTSCHLVREEAVNGEAANLYSAHSETEDDKVDSQVWISKRSGLILKQELDVDSGGGIGKSHSSVRYEYKNVTAPNLGN